MTEYTKLEAVEDIVREAMKNKNTKRGYGSVCKALLMLGLNGNEIGRILYLLSYADNTGKPYQWLFEKNKR